MCAEIGSLWEVLAQQAVGILVGAALPGTVRVAEVDLQPSADPQVRMLRHLCPLIPVLEHARWRSLRPRQTIDSGPTGASKTAKNVTVACRPPSGTTGHPRRATLRRR